MVKLVLYEDMSLKQCLYLGGLLPRRDSFPVPLLSAKGAEGTCYSTPEGEVSAASASPSSELLKFYLFVISYCFLDKKEGLLKTWSSYHTLLM